MRINLTTLFKANLCSFEMAKLAAAAGMTCANTFLAFDQHGELTDGGWLQTLDPKNLIYFPAVNICLAILMLEDTDLKLKELSVIEESGVYLLEYRQEKYIYDNLVDCIIAVWAVHKK